MNIAALDDIRVLPETQEEIRGLASADVWFPSDTAVPTSELIQRTGAAEAVLVSTATKLDRAYFAACPTVRYVGLCGTSTAYIDLEAVKARKIAFTNVTDYGDEPTAEYIFMQLEALARGAGKYQWQDAPRELMGKSLGVIGLGALGKTIANLALAYNMRASYFSLHRKPNWEARGLRYEALRDLLATSDIVVISTPTDVRVLGSDEFGLLKTNSILVQASLGTPFDTDAFLEWIARLGNFAMFDHGVGADNVQVYQGLDRVMLSAFSWGVTYEARQRLGQRVVANLRQYVTSR